MMSGSVAAIAWRILLHELADALDGFRVTMDDFRLDGFDQGSLLYDC